MESQVYSRMPYRVLLRAVGAYLDDRDARRVSVMEEPDGVIVRYGRSEEQGTEITQLGWGTLVRCSVDLEGRRMDPYGHGRSDEGHSTYQDLFRAIGHELDEVGATSLVLAEADPVLVVRYIYVHGPTERIRQDRISELGPRERLQLLQEAHARRHPDPADRSCTASRAATGVR